MQVYVKYRAYFNKKQMLPSLKIVTDYIYVLQSKADHQGSKILFIDFRWTGPKLLEKTLPKNQILVIKIGTNKKQVLHIGLRHFTHKYSMSDERSTTPDCEPDLEVTIKHDDLYPKACESDFGKSSFDKNPNKPSPFNPR